MTSATYRTAGGGAVTTHPHPLPWGACQWICSGCGRRKTTRRRDLNQHAEQHAATCRRIPR